MTADGPRDVVFAHEDDIDSSRVASDGVAVRWDEHDDQPVAGVRPFCFEFKPRGEIVKVEFELAVRAFGSDPATDTICFWAAEEPTVICKDFSAFVKAEGKVAVSFPAAANAGATLKESDRALYGKLMTGRLRCVISGPAWLRGANFTVTYAGGK